MKKRILLDMDGVVANLMAPWLHLYNREYGDSLEPADILSWGAHNYVKPECGVKMYKYLLLRGIFTYCPAYAGAQAAVQELVDMGHEVLFATIPPKHSKYAVAEKTQWVEKYFPMVGGDNMIFTRHKNLIRADFLVDDYEQNLVGFQGERLLFDRPWNRHVVAHENNMLRVEGWEHIVAVIRGLN